MSINHETILYVDLKALENNYNYFKKKLKSDTKIIAVVKAYAYGHGDIRIAKKLSELGVHAFWVADFEEGINLRKSGITMPIIVANPGAKSYNEIIKYNLEPIIYNFRLLERALASSYSFTYCYFINIDSFRIN
jgi:alanine racemase